MCRGSFMAVAVLVLAIAGLVHHAAAAPTCHGKVATFVMTVPGGAQGTAGDDVIIGTSGNDGIDTTGTSGGEAGGVDFVCAGGGGDVGEPFPQVEVRADRHLDAGETVAGGVGELGGEVGAGQQQRLDRQVERSGFFQPSVRGRAPSSWSWSWSCHR